MVLDSSTLVLTVLGTRPQFIKAAPVSRALQGKCREIIVHTGQHYDDDMSRVFFDELCLPPVAHDLEVGSDLHGRQTAEMLWRLEELMRSYSPDCVLVYGDTNSTVAGALAASKLDVALVHVEAGVRSFNRAMPEEINRLVTDACADVLCCPSMSAQRQLEREGRFTDTYFVGDVMLDANIMFRPTADARDTLNSLDLEAGAYYLATIHRPYNTDHEAHLRLIVNELAGLDRRVVWPVHPRTALRLREFGIDVGSNVFLCSPMGFLDMCNLVRGAAVVITDSGGLQKEAYFNAVPCVTVRSETEWTETVESGWNRLADVLEPGVLAMRLGSGWPTSRDPTIYGDGKAARKVAALIEERVWLKRR